jgi:hypothetical protein
MPNQCKPDTQTQTRFMQPPAPTQYLESDQHNKREASLVGPSHRNSRPQGASAKPIPILSPSGSSVLAQTSLIPDPLLPFTPPEDQLIWDSRTIDCFNQFHSLSTTPLCSTLQLTRCFAPPQYLLNAHHPLLPISPEDQLVSDLHTIAYLISPTPIHVHPNQSNPTHLQYSLLPGSLPDHPDEAKRRTIVKILRREKPAYSPFYPPAEEHERRPAASFLNHQDPATTADAKTPQDRGAHRIFRPLYFKNNIHIKCASTFDSTLGHPGEDVAQPNITSHGYRWPHAADGISIALFR